MLPSFKAEVVRLSKLQRDFLIDHVDGMRPFIDNQIENQTRASLLVRKLIRLEPNSKSRVGVPDGTVITERGREAMAYILGCYADSICLALRARDNLSPEVRHVLSILDRYVTTPTQGDYDDRNS